MCVDANAIKCERAKGAWLFAEEFIGTAKGCWLFEENVKSLGDRI